jgi:Sperm-tail PG-rich repeat
MSWLQVPRATGPAFTMPTTTHTPAPPRQPQYQLGPGEYDPVPALPEGPAFTMASKPGARATSSPDLLDEPGPGEYEAPLPRPGPAFTMAPRPALRSADHNASGREVGPAAYDVAPAFPAGVAYSMAARGRQQEGAEIESTPGALRTLCSQHLPYAGRGLASVMQFLCSALQAEGHHCARVMRARCVAGPQSYNVHMPASAGPAFTMQGRHALGAPGEASPGPAAYDADAKVLGPSTPAFSIAVRPADVASASDGPAPGDYCTATTTSLGGQAYSIPAAGAAGEDREPDYKPGPGEYEAHVPGTGPAYSVPRAGREVEHHNAVGRASTPGPGEYAVPQLSCGPAFSVPGAPAPSLNVAGDRAALPGPGQYQAAEPDRGPAYTMAGKAKPEEVQADAVGPGTYSMPEPASAPAFTIQVHPSIEPPATKARLTRTQTCLSMPPDVHPCNRHVGLSKRRVQGRGALSAAAAAVHAGSPGPGAYAEAQVPIGPAYSIPAAGAAADEMPAQPSPGPGQYQARQVEPGPAYSIPAAERKDGAYDQSASPGPGEYHQQDGKDSGPAYSIPKASLEEPGAKVVQPGPGEYGHDTTRPQQHGPAYSIAGKCAPMPANARHSCWQHCLPVSHAWQCLNTPSRPRLVPCKATQHKFCRWPDEKPLEDTSLLPGPQDYCPGSPSPGPAFTIGNNLPHAAATDTPGPGAHTVADVQAGPAYTMLARPQDTSNAEQLPGPAAYAAKVWRCCTSPKQSNPCDVAMQLADRTGHNVGAGLAGTRAWPNIYNRWQACGSTPCGDSTRAWRVSSACCSNWRCIHNCRQACAYSGGRRDAWAWRVCHEGAARGRASIHYCSKVPCA